MEDHEEKKVRGLYTKRHYLENNYREAQGKALSDRFKSDFKCDCINKSTLRFFKVKPISLIRTLLKFTKIT